MIRTASVPGQVFAALALVLAGCGKDAVLRDRLGQLEPGDGSRECPAERRLRWSFTQPAARTGRAVDLLFVVDTSSSLSSERARLAAQVPAFLERLAPDTDARISVMLGHGGASDRAGRLYSAPGFPRVQRNDRQTREEIALALEQTLRRRSPDVDEADGEALLFSLNRSLAPDRLAEIRAQGFYRDDAALSIVFIADENDLCFPPELHGFPDPPHRKPSPGNSEAAGYRKHCLDAQGRPNITPEGTLQALRRLKGELPVSLGAITHLNGATVPAAGQASIGHGYLELLALSLHGVPMDLPGADYRPGLAQLANVVTRQLRLRTVFPLAGGEAADPLSVSAAVDGRPVLSRFEAATATLELPVEQAGGEGSAIEVRACRL